MKRSMGTAGVGMDFEELVTWPWPADWSGDFDNFGCNGNDGKAVTTRFGDAMVLAWQPARGASTRAF